MTIRIVADGTQVYGTFTITLNTGNVFTMEELSVNRGTSKATDQTSQGTVNRHRETVSDPYEWTGTLQLASSDAAYPAFGNTFTLTVDDNYGVETFICRPPNFAASNQSGGIRKIPITGWVAVNPTQITTAS